MIRIGSGGGGGNSGGLVQTGGLPNSVDVTPFCGGGGFDGKKKAWAVYGLEAGEDMAGKPKPCKGPNAKGCGASEKRGLAVTDGNHTGVWDGEFTCKCINGYEGENCEIPPPAAGSIVDGVFYGRCQQGGDITGCLDEWEQSILDSHNEYRSNHKNTNPVKWDKTLANNAQKYAEHLAKEKKFEHSNRKEGKYALSTGKLWGGVEGDESG